MIKAKIYKYHFVYTVYKTRLKRDACSINTTRSE